MAGLYVHIPFCASKCSYCDFYSIRFQNPPFRQFADALISELRHEVKKSDFTINTLYFGGGTPSLIPDDIFTYLIQYFRDIIGSRWSVSEFTIEANPDDINPQKAEAWIKSGVNRVSLGVQSMVDSELKTVGRRHNSDAVVRARSILDEFTNISADLIFGLPGQTLNSLKFSLDKIFSLNFTHLSIYSLMYEPGTILTHRLTKGLIKEQDDEVVAEMYRLISDKARAAGFRHYEISNYARPGFESQHNSSYWNGTPYIGIGPGAHSFDGIRTRKSNTPNLKNYLAGKNDVSIEVLADDELINENIMIALRTSSGIDLSHYNHRFGKSALDKLLKKAEKYLGAELLRSDGKSLSLTDQGIMVSDSIIVGLMV